MRPHLGLSLRNSAQKIITVTTFKNILSEKNDESIPQLIGIWPCQYAKPWVISIFMPATAILHWDSRAQHSQSGLSQSNRLWVLSVTEHGPGEASPRKTSSTLTVRTLRRFLSRSRTSPFCTEILLPPPPRWNSGQPRRAGWDLSRSYIGNKFALRYQFGEFISNCLL